MQGYESIFILDPEVSEAQQTELTDKFKSLVTGQGGQVLHHAVWGRRKLAYEVKKREYGIYHLFYLDRTPAALQALEYQFRIDDNVIKYLTVGVEDVEKEHAAFEQMRSEGSLAQKLGD